MRTYFSLALILLINSVYSAPLYDLAVEDFLFDEAEDNHVGQIHDNIGDKLNSHHSAQKLEVRQLAADEPEAPKRSATMLKAHWHEVPSKEAQAAPIVAVATNSYYNANSDIHFASSPYVPSSPSEIVKESICPKGFFMNDKHCSKHEYIKPAHVCPPNTVQHGKVCASTYQPTIECRNGYQLRDGKCLSYTMTPAQLTCSDSDASLDATGLGCSVIKPQPPRCPDGYEVTDNNQCVRYVPSKFQCPDGYTMDSNQNCILTRVFEATMICPEASVLNTTTNQCVVKTQGAPYCPHQYNFDANTKKCARPVQAVPASCPAEFRPTGNVCESVSRSPAEYSCAADFTLDKTKTCVKEVQSEPECPPGFQHSTNSFGACEKIVKEIPTCPAGSTLVGSDNSFTCQSIRETDAFPTCVSGFDLVDGKCTRYETSQADLSCRGDCYDIVEKPVAFACPTNAEFIDDPAGPRCIQENTEKLCEPAPRPHCDILLRKDGEGGGALRALTGDAKAVECQHVPLPVCKDVLRKAIKLAEPYCPDGGEMKNGRCYARMPKAIQKSCKVGVLDQISGQCVRQIFSPLQYECPAGTKHQGRRCTDYETHHPQFICPDDSQEGPDGCCLKQIPATIPAPQIIQSPPQIRCSSGELSGDKDCVLSVQLPMAMECPPESTDTSIGRGDYSSRCHIFADLIMPEPVEKTVKASFICPDGSRANNRECQTTETVRPQSVCPDPYRYEDGKCSMYTELQVPPPVTVTTKAIPICLAGTQQKGSTCVSTQETDALTICPVGHHFDGVVCRKEVSVQTVCPSGLELHPEGCFRTVHSVPMTRIVQGCSHQVAIACPTCPRVVSSACSRL